MTMCKEEVVAYSMAWYLHEEAEENHGQFAKNFPVSIDPLWFWIFIYHLGDDVGSAAGVILGLSPGVEKDGEDL
jgi:hypothetical protein